MSNFQRHLARGLGVTVGVLAAVPYVLGQVILTAVKGSPTPAKSRPNTAGRQRDDTEHVGPIPGPTLATLIDRLKGNAPVFLDTNILMSPAYYPALNRFLDALAARGAHLSVSAIQREEIQRLRKAGEPSQQSLASKANRWLMAGAERQVILFLDATAGVRTSYLDDEIVRTARMHLANPAVAAPFVYVVTDDVELTGRLHSVPLALQRDPADVVVITGRQFAALILNAPG
jgi:hypothetical protein